ncbi:MAG TPA: GAF domain-containing protein [Planctomycetota bacterium]|nr:GAF domain-containing protein [Planctomycetota bacterium]
MTETVLTELYHRLRIREAALDRILHLFQDLSNPRRTFQDILEIVTEAIPADASSLFLVTAEDGTMTVVAATGPVADKVKGMKLPPGVGMPGVVARDRRTVAVSDVKKEPNYSRERHKIAGYETTSLLAVPVLYKGDLTGVLEVLNRKDGPEWMRHEVELLERLARGVGSIVNLIGERR